MKSIVTTLAITALIGLGSAYAIASEPAPAPESAKVVDPRDAWAANLETCLKKGKVFAENFGQKGHFYVSQEFRLIRINPGNDTYDKIAVNCKADADKAAMPARYTTTSK